MKAKLYCKRIFLALSALLVMLLPFFENALSKKVVFADNSKIVDYDKTAIEDDLSDIDISRYPQTTTGNVELIRFQEYCYSEKAFYKEAYGLYFYIYNPTEKAVARTGNEVNIAVSYDDKGNPVSYENVPLTLLDEVYNGRFLKFKITNDNPFLERVQSYAKEYGGKRRYDIAGVQLYYTDGSSAEDIGISQTYTWTGFAKGLGSSNEDSLTLSCEALKTLSLGINSTYYRPQGSNGTNNYTQDTLHSVYFSVPNDMIEEYGELTAIKAEYLGAVLKPMLCTGNLEAYNAISQYLGVSFSETYSGYNSNLNYTYLTNIEKGNWIGAGTHSAKGFNAFVPMNFALKVFDGGLLEEWAYDPNNSLKELDSIDSLYLLFGTDSWAEDSADSYAVKAEDIKTQMKESATKFGNPIQGAEGVYSKDIFESIDSEYTPLYLKGDDKFSLTSEVISQNFWDKLFGNHTVESSTLYDGIKAIHKVDKNDITGNKILDCNKLFISESDYDNFCSFYNESVAKEETVYLFRYRVSEYTSSEATLFQFGHYTGMPIWLEKDTNAFFFQQAVDLDFDIIEVSFTDEDGTTVIGVVADPLDVVHDGTSPLDTTSDKIGGLLKLAFRFLLLILLLPLIVILIYKFLLFVINIPSKLSNRRYNAKKQNRGKKRK